VQVKVFFHASGDRAVEFAHLLKLYPDSETTGIAVGETPVEGKPVVSEREPREEKGEKKSRRRSESTSRQAQKLRLATHPPPFDRPVHPDCIELPHF
jgi:hypothetical protein